LVSVSVVRILASGLRMAAPGTFILIELMYGLGTPADPACPEDATVEERGGAWL
jgi:hypothetical protein